MKESCLCDIVKEGTRERDRERERERGKGT